MIKYAHMEIDLKKGKQYPEGHFVTRWMVIGIAVMSGFGIPLSIVTGNHAFIGVGPALGLPVGLAIGTSVEARHKKKGNIRPLTEEEKARKLLGKKTGLIFLGVLVFTGLLALLLHI